MSDEIVIAAGEIDGLADTLEDVSTDYASLSIETTNIGDDVTGHVELAGNLPDFASFVMEVVAALGANAASFAGELRVSSQLICDNEETTYESIKSIQMPKFDAHAEMR